MLSAGVYGLNFRREGFYPEIAAGYDYTVNAGWEAVYNPKVLESCPNGNCDPKLRPRKLVLLSRAKSGMSEAASSLATMLTRAVEGLSAG